MNALRSPKTVEEFSRYFQLRWEILRKPWQQHLGSEQDLHENQSIHRMIIDDDNKVLAVGRLEHSAAHQGQIRFMAVCENVQGQGLGQQIITELENIAAQVGITELILNARESAVNFYQKLGYQQHDISHVLFGEVTHYRMSKTIHPTKSHQIAVSQALTNVWHETIPMSKAMGLQISYYDSQKLITVCDPQFNKNLHNTMFAGSIYTLATLTGWGWVYLKLEEHSDNLEGDIVLADANIRYHSPIKGLVYAKVSTPEVSGNFENLKKGKNARIKLQSHVYCGDNIAATFIGSYFVLPKTGEK